MRFDLKCGKCGRVIEMHCCNSCGGELELIQASGNPPVEAALPRIEERGSDGSIAVLHRPEPAILSWPMARDIMVERFERADRAIAIQVQQDVYHSGTALAVLHQLADSLSDGDAALRERMVPSRTEDAARRRLPAKDERIWP